MKRLSVLQYLVDKNDYRKYLEIGVHKGALFLALDCPEKVAVDPRFQIDFTIKLKMLVKKRGNFRNKYFEMTSDEFFEKQSSFLKDFGLFDLVFVDGLHTFEGSLKDVLHSLDKLNEKGCIVMHDCFPPRKAAATPATSYEKVNKLKPEGWNGLWCGDVWKTIYYLKKQYGDVLDIKVLNTDFGLGIIKPKNGALGGLKINKEVFDEINVLEYEFLRSNPEEIIGLKDKEYLFQGSNKSLF